MLRSASMWKQTACILCECNCGIEVRLGGDDGRRFERIRGDKAHPASQGYTCEKALRLDHYQNGRAPADDAAAPPRRRHVRGDRLGHRHPEVAARLRRGARRARRRVDLLLRRRRPGEPPRRRLRGGDAAARSAPATARARSPRRRPASSGSTPRCSAPWSAATSSTARSRCSSARTRGSRTASRTPATTLKEIARDPSAALIVIDPRRTETAELADIHLQVRPGTDAWLLAALAARSSSQEGLVDRAVAGRPRRRRSTRSRRRSRARRRSPTTAAIARRRRGRWCAPRPGASPRRASVAVLRGPRRPDEPALDAGQLPARSWSGC